jgi:acylphosphatase
MSHSQASDLRLHATVKGWVQGVGFRYFVLETAVQLGLAGWVRNCWDGSVEVLAEGKKSRLENLLAALRNGPRVAHVSDVEVEWRTATGEFKGFNVRPTL